MANITIRVHLTNRNDSGSDGYNLSMETLFSHAGKDSSYAAAHMMLPDTQVNNITQKTYSKQNNQESERTSRCEINRNTQKDAQVTGSVANG